ncbi:MAG: stage V sporulation protein AD [Peptococcaceae bacterium]|jgi:stage V sporulation protein AD|nr:stage V sporulation protein AD [Peptococcaceae bacterium]MDH7525306.1 stage V sporulation protein AD [Peptococcaceae bacterium]
MAQNKIGKQTWQFAARPVIASWGTAVGPMEGQGPLRDHFDMILDSNLVKGDKSWEESEQRLMQHSMELALEKAGMKAHDLDFYLAGDLLNQIITANFSARFFGIPFFGLYGACSTLAEGLALGASLLNAGYADNVGVSASSHYGTAERQLRYPTELGAQRLPTAQWTVTGAGSYVLNMSKTGVGIAHATVGKVKDMGISNASDMGTAMAPAAFDTINVNLQDLGRKMSDYDLVVTGDLGQLGLNALKELLASEGHSTNNVSDCGTLIYDPDQDTHAGGSGCGCSAVVLGYLLKQMLEKKYHRVFFVGTGALLSPTSVFQGDSIPCIAHGVVLEYY